MSHFFCIIPSVIKSFENVVVNNEDVDIFPDNVKLHMNDNVKLHLNAE
jgi:hypothetical protein